ncbi:DUF2059 domain-containing protein [Roseomonas sp. WA12]
MMRITLLAAALLAASPALAQAPATPAPATPAPTAPAPAIPMTEEGRAAARELLRASGATALGDQVMAQMNRQLALAIAQASGKPPQEVMAVVDEVLMPEFRRRQPEMTDAMAEAWATAMTPAELRELTAFYDSAIGKRMVAVTPQVMNNLMSLGMRWGQQVAQDAIAKHRDALRARGLTL